MSAGAPGAGLSRPRDYSAYLGLALLFAIVQLQVTVMPEAALGGSMPLLPVLAVVIWGILRGPAAGGWWALVLGWLLDWRSPEPLGTYTLAMLGVALVCGLGSRRVFSHNLLLPAVLVTLGTLVYLLAQLLIVAILGGNVAWDRASLSAVMVPAVALNLLWLPVVYFPLRSLADRMGAPRIGWER